MWATLTPAIIGLVGVLVGALISTGANYWLAVRKEATDAALEKAKRSIELKTAARLIANELLVGSAVVTMLVEKRKWVDDVTKLPLVAWERDKAIIARELSYADWHAVTTAALAVEQFRDFAPVPQSEPTDRMKESGKVFLRDIRAGLEALTPYTLD